MLRSVHLNVLVLRVDTLDDSPDSGPVVIFVLTDSGIPGWGGVKRVLLVVP